jgi:hypothetical protein
MTDRVTANLPSRDMDSTAAFYQTLGFQVRFKDRGWMIMTRDALELEFFPYPDLDPKKSSFSACMRVDDLESLYQAFSGSGLSASPHAIPRLTPPRVESHGLLIFALVDLDGSLLRCIENKS